MIPAADEAEAARLPVILCTLGTLGVGGTELRMLELFTALRERYPELRPILYVTGTPGELTAEFEAIGATIVFGRGGLPGFNAFRRVCRRYRPDIAHFNHGLASGLFGLAAATSGVRRRYAHLRSLGDNWSGLSGSIKRFVGRVLTRMFCTRVIGVADSIRAYAKVPRRQWLTIHDGVVVAPGLEACAARQAERARDRALAMVFLGRISPEKNWPRAIRIAEAVIASGCDAQLRFVGPAPIVERAKLAEAISASSAAARISWDGPTRDPIGTLCDADVLVLPSFREGLPGAVLEALSAGTPVVGADLPGLREIARHAKGVTIVPLGADDGEWARAVIEARKGADRVAIARSIAAAPFSFGQHLSAMIRLWGLPNR